MPAPPNFSAWSAQLDHLVKTLLDLQRAFPSLPYSCTYYVAVRYLGNHGDTSMIATSSSETSSSSLGGRHRTFVTVANFQCLRLDTEKCPVTLVLLDMQSIPKNNSNNSNSSSRSTHHGVGGLAVLSVIIELSQRGVLVLMVGRRVRRSASAPLQRLSMHV